MRHFSYVCLLVLITTHQAFAWGPEGHKAVGAIADRLIVGTQAAKEINALLGGFSLEQASVWADCAKGIDPAADFTYPSPGRYPECAIFETPALEEEMGDFVRRNDTNCNRKPDDESCHKQYHYTDVAIQHHRYQNGWVGTRDFDIVHAMLAAIRVLKGEPVPAPFNFNSPREALLLLAHYVGDLHQPLHVGAIYLDEKGNPVNPGAFNLQTDTHGGNSILLKGTNMKLHAQWDGIPLTLTASQVDAALLKPAKAIGQSAGGVYDWPGHWADDSLAAAQHAFVGLKFSPLQNGFWTTVLSEHYQNKKQAVQKKQLIKAGARLAELLRTIWPSQGVGEDNASLMVEHVVRDRPR